MSKNSNVNNNRSQEPNNMFVQTTGGGKNAPKQIHVAHRRSQSELTNLMIEQFTFAEAVGASSSTAAAVDGSATAIGTTDRTIPVRKFWL